MTLNKLVEAAANGDADEVRRLTGFSDHVDHVDNVYYEALHYANLHGHVECVKLLIPFISNNKNSYMMKLSAAADLAVCVRVLIPTVTPLECHEALVYAAAYGNAACVRVLLNTTTDYEEALYQAVVNLSCECVDILYPLGDPETVLKRVKQVYPNDELFWVSLEERIGLDQQRALLLREAGLEHTTPPPRKM